MRHAATPARRRYLPTPESFEFLFDAMAEGVLVLSPERRILYLNQAAADFFGTLAVGLVGRRFDDLVEAGEGWEEIFARAASGLRVYKDARLGGHDVHVRIGRLRTAGGGFAVLLQDLEPLRRSERRLASAMADLRRSNRQKSLFLSVVSHDLRAPASAALGLLRGLLDGVEGDLSEVQRRDIEAAVRNLEHMADLVRDLLEVLAIEEGPLPLSPVEVSVNDIVEGPVERLRPLFREKNVALETTVAPGLPPLRVDVRRIDQVLQNLLSNALKFTPPRGRVDLRVEAAGRAVRFRVADTGPGVPADEADGIFDPYRTGRRGRTAGGVGLGLAICRGIVEGHGGTIRLEAAGGPGAAFVFEIPACDSPAESAPDMIS